MSEGVGGKKKGGGQRVKDEYKEAAGRGASGRSEAERFNVRKMWGKFQ